METNYVFQLRILELVALDMIIIELSVNNLIRK